LIPTELSKIPRHVCSQKGLVERFDSTIGAGTVIPASIAKWSPFHGAMFAVIESVAKIVAMGF